MLLKQLHFRVNSQESIDKIAEKLNIEKSIERANTSYYGIPVVINKHTPKDKVLLVYANGELLQSFNLKSND